MNQVSEHIKKQGGAGAPEEEGIVESVAGDIVRVKIVRSSSCSTCAIVGNCPFNSLGKKDWLVWAKNEKNAKPGDGVKVSIAPRRYLFIAALVFLLPVATLLIVYIGLRSIGTEDKLAVGASVIFAFLSYLVIRGIDRHSSKANYSVVEIVGKEAEEIISDS